MASKQELVYKQLVIDQGRVIHIYTDMMNRMFPLIGDGKERQKIHDEFNGSISKLYKDRIQLLKWSLDPDENGF